MSIDPVAVELTRFCFILNKDQQITIVINSPSTSTPDTGLCIEEQLSMALID
jgi:hypothetical protein